MVGSLFETIGLFLLIFFFAGGSLSLPCQAVQGAVCLGQERRAGVLGRLGQLSWSATAGKVCRLLLGLMAVAGLQKVRQISPFLSLSLYSSSLPLPLPLPSPSLKKLLEHIFFFCHINTSFLSYLSLPDPAEHTQEECHPPTRGRHAMCGFPSNYL